MTARIKAMTSIWLVTLLGLSLTCDAMATPGRSAAGAQHQIQHCVAEIASRVDYSDAARVMHWVLRLEQKNLSEMRITLRSNLYDNQNIEKRSLLTTCVVASGGKVVSFRIDAADTP